MVLAIFKAALGEPETESPVTGVSPPQTNGVSTRSISSMSADPVTVKRQHRRAREHLAESSTHGSATGSLIEVPRRGDVVEFNE
jgi:hypothetical protein